MFSPELTQQLAAELQQAQDTRVQLEHFSKRFPGMTIEDGYRVSRAWVALQLAQGRQVIGHKIGLTSRAMQQSSQIDEPDYGTLLDSMLYTCTPAARPVSSTTPLTRRMAPTQGMSTSAGETRRAPTTMPALAALSLMVS